MHSLQETLTSHNVRQFMSNEMVSFFKINDIAHNKTTPLWPQANGKVEQINHVIQKAVQSSVNEGCHWKHELDTFLLNYRNTSHCTTGKTLSFLLFSRVVRDKSSTVPSTVDSSGHDDAIKLNRAQKQKMKTSLSMRNEEQN